jgi:hypothetical protein
MTLTASAKSESIADFSASMAGHIQAWVWTGVNSQTTTQTLIDYVFGFKQTQSYSDTQDFDAWINGTNVHSETTTNNKGADEWQFYTVTKTYNRPAYGSADVYQDARCRVDGIFDGPTSDTGTHNITTKVPAKAGTVLAAPSGVYWAAATSSSLTFNWSDPPSAGIGPAPDNMWVQLATDPGFTNLVANGFAGNVNTWTATGLTRATTYYFRVYAHNSVGASPFSGGVGGTTSPTVPDTMAAPTVLTPTTDGFSVQFTAPNNGGSAISSYEIQVSKDNFATVAATFTGVTSSPKVLTGLSPGTKYRARVRAINAVGGASWSASSAEIQTLGGVKVWNGTAWIEGIVRTWDGSSWKVVVVRKWNGSSWVV